MLAKLHFRLPFEVICPVETSFTIHPFSIDGYEVYILPLAKSDRPPGAAEPESIKMDGKVAYQADIFRATFKKERFKRQRDAEVDPPATLIAHVLNSFIVRLKYVTRSHQIRTIPDIHQCQWTLQYFNDDESELPPEEGLCRTRITFRCELNPVRCDPIVWDKAFSLPLDFVSSSWRELLTDASGALPHVGTAVVLAATSLEIFVAEVLNACVDRTAIPDPLWLWINKRSSFRQEPSVEEQFDVLLKIVVGHSLKENLGLWESFLHLKQARNKFVHEGKARIANVEVTEQTVRILIKKAEEIISLVRQWLPHEMQWPVFEIPPLTLEVAKEIYKTPPQSEKAPGNEVAFSNLWVRPT